MIVHYLPGVTFFPYHNYSLTYTIFPSYFRQGNINQLINSHARNSKPVSPAAVGGMWIGRTGKHVVGSWENKTGWRLIFL